MEICAYTSYINIWWGLKKKPTYGFKNVVKWEPCQEGGENPGPDSSFLVLRTRRLCYVHWIGGGWVNLWPPLCVGHMPNVGQSCAHFHGFLSMNQGLFNAPVCAPCRVSHPLTIHLGWLMLWLGLVSQVCSDCGADPHSTEFGAGGRPVPMLFQVLIPTLEGCSSVLGSTAVQGRFPLSSWPNYLGERCLPETRSWFWGELLLVRNASLFTRAVLVAFGMGFLLLMRRTVGALPNF